MRVYYVTKRALSVDDRRLTRESSKEKKKKKANQHFLFEELKGISLSRK